MNSRRIRHVALALAALTACAAAASLAIADEPAPESAGPEQAALERFCGDRDPCVVINGAANPDSGDEAKLTTLGKALAASGKPADACPEARQAYEDVGIKADAFVGPCPEGPKFSAEAEETARANTEAALESRGGSR